ncbi:hypothetical protein BD410DRAFT_800541 [Rickenella mellea]|uniref:Uncharacterized protein n=1 Tax=Rickenella mellea TaxID=50990 RepID=A0A4Y7QIN1_9AGAM|nr:hypothetical protein BD410DRAFT_800541 [Rickenella mellea]
MLGHEFLFLHGEEEEGDDGDWIVDSDSEEEVQEEPKTRRATRRPAETEDIHMTDAPVQHRRSTFSASQQRAALASRQLSAVKPPPELSAVLPLTQLRPSVVIDTTPNQSSKRKLSPPSDEDPIMIEYVTRSAADSEPELIDDQFMEHIAIEKGKRKKASAPSAPPRPNALALKNSDRLPHTPPTSKRKSARMDYWAKMQLINAPSVKSGFVTHQPTTTVTQPVTQPSLRLPPPPHPPQQRSDNNNNKETTDHERPTTDHGPQTDHKRTTTHDGQRTAASHVDQRTTRNEQRATSVARPKTHDENKCGRRESRKQRRAHNTARSLGRQHPPAPHRSLAARQRPLATREYAKTPAMPATPPLAHEHASNQQPTHRSLARSARTTASHHPPRLRRAYGTPTPAIRRLIEEKSAQPPQRPNPPLDRKRATAQAAHPLPPPHRALEKRMEPSAYPLHHPHRSLEERATAQPPSARSTSAQPRRHCQTTTPPQRARRTRTQRPQHARHDGTPPRTMDHSRGGCEGRIK